MNHSITIVPMLPSPETGRKIKKYSSKRDKLSLSERESIFLENGDKNYRPLHVKSSYRYLANSSSAPSAPYRPDVSPYFFGTLSVIGLFMLYRAIQNYS